MYIDDYKRIAHISRAYSTFIRFIILPTNGCQNIVTKVCRYVPFQWIMYYTCVSILIMLILSMLFAIRKKAVKNRQIHLV